MQSVAVHLEVRMRYGDFKRWLYAGNRPNAIARVLNRGWAALHSLGIAPDYLVTLEVVGRKSGKTISFPLVMMCYAGQRYLVSMLGEHAAWVRNVRAANGRAPGARPHVAVDKDAPLQAFVAIAPAMPVFRVQQDTAFAQTSADSATPSLGNC